MNILILVHPDCLSEQYSYTPQQAEEYLEKLEAHLPKFDYKIIIRMERVNQDWLDSLNDNQEDVAKQKLHYKKIMEILNKYADMQVLDMSCGKASFANEIGSFLIEHPKSTIYLSGGYQDNCLRLVAQNLTDTLSDLIKELEIKVKTYTPLVFYYKKGFGFGNELKEKLPWWDKDWIDQYQKDSKQSTEKRQYKDWADNSPYPGEYRRGDWWEGATEKLAKPGSSQRAIVANNQFTLGLDIDDTICITSPLFTKALQEKGYNVKEENKDASRWYKSSIGNVPKEVEEEVFVDFIKNGAFSDLKVIPGVVELLTKLKKDGVRIVLITARPEGQLGKVTKEWLAKNRIPYDALYFAEDKGPIAKKEGVDLFVDDDLRNAFDKQKVLMINQPWNTKYDGKRIESLKELEELIKKPKTVMQQLKRNCIVSSLEQADQNRLREQILEGLGVRPENFKYKGPEALWIHWGEFEELDEALKAWSAVAGKDLEICVSSITSGSTSCLGGILLQGIPSYHFPIDVHSYYDKRNGKRFIIPEDRLDKRQTSILSQFLRGAIEIEEKKGYDEAWLNAKDAVFLGFVAASYGKTSEDFFKPEKSSEAGQFLSILPTLESVLQKGYRCWLAGPRGSIPQEIDRTTLEALKTFNKKKVAIKNSQVKKPLKRNYDFGGNYLDRLKKVLKKKKASKDLSSNSEVKAEYKNWKVLRVDGVEVRDNIKIDFVFGDNPAHNSKDVPKKTIWIEKVVSKKDEVATLIHELVEYFNMTDKDKDYDAAHNIACKAEQKYRDGGEFLEILEGAISDKELCDIAKNLVQQYNTNVREASLKKVSHIMPREPVSEDTDLSGGYIERMKKRLKPIKALLDDLHVFKEGDRFHDQVIKELRKKRAREEFERKQKNQNEIPTERIVKKTAFLESINIQRTERKIELQKTIKALLLEDLLDDPKFRDLKDVREFKNDEDFDTQIYRSLQKKKEREEQERRRKEQSKVPTEKFEKKAFIATAYIRQEDSQWFVYSEKGKKLSKGYSSKKQAEERLREIEYFKHKKSSLAKKLMSVALYFKKATKEYYTFEEILETLVYGIPDLKIEKKIGEKKDFAGCEEESLPFAYGEIPNFINPADEMGWDIIILPSAIALTKEEMIPVGVLRYNRDSKFWEGKGEESPIGNDKIILGKRESQGTEGGIGIYTQDDVKALSDFLLKKDVFESPEFFFKVKEQ